MLVVRRDDGCQRGLGGWRREMDIGKEVWLESV